MLTLTSKENRVTACWITDSRQTGTNSHKCWCASEHSSITFTHIHKQKYCNNFYQENCKTVQMYRVTVPLSFKYPALSTIKHTRYFSSLTSYNTAVWANKSVQKIKTSYVMEIHIPFINGLDLVWNELKNYKEPWRKESELQQKFPFYRTDWMRCSGNN